MSVDIRITNAESIEWQRYVLHPAYDANKYSRGKLTIVGGCASYPGSVCLAAKAAYRMGAGYVEVFCSAETALAVHTSVFSAVARDWSSFNAETYAKASEHPIAILAGSGMDASSEWQMNLARDAIRHVRVPAVIDGGAISAMACDAGIEICRCRFEDGLPSVFTPHAGEAKRLARAAGIDFPESATNEDLAYFAYALSERYCSTILLKGPASFVASLQDAPEEVVVVTKTTPALAKAGTGDVLAGMVSALMAQGADPYCACVAAASLHADSGIIAQERLGDVSVMAEDIVESIPRAVLNL